MSMSNQTLDDTPIPPGVGAASPATGSRHDPRTRLLLEAPIAATLVRLAAPTPTRWRFMRSLSR